LQRLSEQDLSQVSGQEGLKMILEDFQISGNQTLELGSGQFSSSSLLLGNLTLDNGFGGGVTTGSNGDPISFDVEGSDNGRWVIELPENDSNMDENDITIGDVWMDDGGGPKVLSDGVSITNAQYAGGTRFALGTIPGGGLQLGIGIVLDGDIEISAPNDDSQITFDQIGGFNNCNNGPTGFDIDTDCSGVLDWASLEQGRPLQIEMFGGGSGRLSMELITNNNVSAGQLVVEDAGMNGENYGEIWTSGIEIRDLQGQGPVNVNSEHTGCQCTR
jgi:hypothetical protein